MAARREGWEGWDTYAAFYDWENARTFGRRDVAFWRRLVLREGARTLELGCGTGRLLTPLARGGASIVGLDRSAPMLARAVVRARRLRLADRPALLRGDIRALPFPRAAFGMVMAPYGMLQSLLDDRDLDATLAEIARVLRPRGLLGVDLVPDLTRWAEYHRRVQLRGRAADGAGVTLIETVRQDRRRGLTTFLEEFVERRGRKETRRRFELAFRTMPVDAIVQRLMDAGFRVESVMGGYDGRPWTPESDAWLIVARRRARGR